MGVYVQVNQSTGAVVAIYAGNNDYGDYTVYTKTAGYLCIGVK